MNKRKIRILPLLLILILVSSFTGLHMPVEASSASTLKVHYIDVGQSDSILIESSGHYMMIDAGDIGDDDIIMSYLDKKKVKKLDYLILTHPHADHIGSAAEIIDNYSIGKILMPPKEHTTKTFEKVLDTIEENGLRITKPVVGTKYEIGKASFKIIAPNETYGSELNNWSIGIRLTNGKNSFLFIGDAEKDSIADMLENGQSLKADVYMCGHHGSDTSTTKALLNAVNPKYAVVSVGKNSYGHPKESVLKMLADKKISTYRTDKAGTVIATSNGVKITFNTEPTVYKTNGTSKKTTGTNKKKTETDNNISTAVYVTKTGKKYHADGCRYLKSSKISISLKSAKASYSPCSVCDPPQ